MLVRQEFGVILETFLVAISRNFYAQISYPKRKKYFKGNMYVQVSSTFQYYLR